MTKRLIVISLDAVASADFEYLKSLPTFGQFLDGAAFCRNVRSVYPSLTYPAHATIVTGVYPNSHGIVNNTLVQPRHAAHEWYWQSAFIKRDTLFDKAIDAGMSTAAILWPVTAGSRIRYNLPEIFPTRPYLTQIMVSLLNGPLFFQIKMNSLYGKLRDGTNQPNLDNFVHECVKHVLRKNRPDLMLAHYTDVDTQKHLHGVDSPETRQAFVRHDKRLSEIIDLLKQEQMYDDSTIVLLGDHSLLQCSKPIRPNRLFYEKGHIRCKHGRITDWDFYCEPSGGSAYIYAKRNGRKHIEYLHRLLERFAERTDGIERIFTAAEAAALGADGSCAFMLEAEPGFFFDKELVSSSDIVLESGTGTGANHGYLPSRPGYETIFMAKGMGIKESVEIESMSLIDEAPTFAHLLGLELGNTDGRALTEMLI